MSQSVPEMWVYMPLWAGGGNPFLRMEASGGHPFLRMHLWWSLCTLYLHACQGSYRRRLRSLLLYLCYVFRTLINSPVCRFFEVQKVSRHLTGQLERSL